jgi:hypothetical protein
LLSFGQEASNFSLAVSIRKPSCYNAVEETLSQIVTDEWRLVNEPRGARLPITSYQSPGASKKEKQV